MNIENLIKEQQQKNNKIIEEIEFNILGKLYKASVDINDTYQQGLNEKIVNLCIKQYGIDFNTKSLETPQIPFLLNGLPGTGKINLINTASKNVCEKLGLSFVLNPLEAYIPKKEDFIQIVVEVGDEGKFNHYLTSHLSKINQTAGGLVLFDLFKPSPSTENILLSIIIEKKINNVDLADISIAFSANTESSHHKFSPTFMSRIHKVDIEGIKNFESDKITNLRERNTFIDTNKIKNI